MKMTSEGLDLIKHFEGFRRTAYQDPIGIWTIGYGHTSMAGDPSVFRGLTISEAKADAILARDVAVFARGVSEQLRTTVSDQQYSALVSFAYNVGLDNFRKSSVLKAVNRQDFAAAGRRLQLWNKAGGRVLPGLVRRRAAEAALFATEHAGSVSKPVERENAKPVHHSKTMWSAFGALVLTVLQAVLATSQKLAGIVLMLAIASLLALIIFERWKKLKEEAL